MNYIKEKRDKTGQCNICGKTEQLTWDHVPPKNCFNNKRTEYNSLFSELISEDKRFEIAQSGIKFRTICRDCNNSLLGSKYDTELKKLVDQLDLMINSRILIKLTKL